MLELNHELWVLAVYIIFNQLDMYDGAELGIRTHEALHLLVHRNMQTLPWCRLPA